MFKSISVFMLASFTAAKCGDKLGFYETLNECKCLDRWAVPVEGSDICSCLDGKSSWVPMGNACGFADVESQAYANGMRTRYYPFDNSSSRATLSNKRLRQIGGAAWNGSWCWANGCWATCLQGGCEAWPKQRWNGERWFPLYYEDGSGPWRTQLPAGWTSRWWWGNGRWFPSKSAWIAQSQAIEANMESTPWTNNLDTLVGGLPAMNAMSGE